MFQEFRTHAYLIAVIFPIWACVCAIFFYFTFPPRHCQMSVFPVIAMQIFNFKNCHSNKTIFYDFKSVFYLRTILK